MSTETDEGTYRVVVNHEEQYSIWPDYREIPEGWRDVGVSGSKDACLDHIEKVWTDMRPLSLRRRMEELGSAPPAEPDLPAEPEGPTLVERLSSGRHPVEVSLRPEKGLDRFRECLDRGYVHLTFTGTQGGTELGIRLDPERTDLTRADLEAGTGEVTLAGSLQLDFVEVRCVADVRLPALEGVGQLVTVEG